MAFQPEKKHRSLARKLVVLILLVNTVLSIITASIQLYLSYQRDKIEVIESVDVISNSFRSSFENALWEYNYGLIDALLDGVVNRSDVAYVELDAGADKIWLRGQSSDELIIKTMTFVHQSPSGRSSIVGEMTIGLTLANVQQRIWAQFWTLMFSNFIKTAIASFIMLALFSIFVTRHLKAIATHVSETSWLKTSKPLTLQRSQVDVYDDLEHIVSAINTAKKKSNHDFETLNIEVKQRRATEFELAQKASVLEQTNKEQAEFTYSISHDLKSPANTVAMLLQELESSQRESLDSKGLQLIDVAQKTIARMGQLIEGVLDYSRAVGEGECTELVDLNIVLSEILEDLQSDIRDANANISVTHMPTVRGNASHLRMVFQNLISNSLKFRSAHRRPEVSLTSITNIDDSFCKIIISDNGIGIDPRYHQKIFSLFQRLHTHREYSGSGIGLALCQRVITNHGGKISVSSTLNEGTTFEILLRFFDE